MFQRDHHGNVREREDIAPAQWIARDKEPDEQGHSEAGDQHSVVKTKSQKRQETFPHLQPS